LWSIANEVSKNAYIIYIIYIRVFMTLIVSHAAWSVILCENHMFTAYIH